MRRGMRKTMGETLDKVESEVHDLRGLQQKT